MYQKRTYRWLIDSDEALAVFEVRVRETDLWMQADKPLNAETRELVLKYRGFIEAYIRNHPGFLYTRDPWIIKEPAPQIVTDMCDAAGRAGVGPMAAVAGAIAEHVGRDLLSLSKQVIVENGGDIFVKLDRPFISAVYAGNSPLSLRFGLCLDSRKNPLSVCTSSGRVGHSFSMGRADAVCVISRSCALADAAATAICNRILSKQDIEAAIDFGKQIKGVLGIVAVFRDKMGVWGEVEVVPIDKRSSASPMKKGVFEAKPGKKRLSF